MGEFVRTADMMERLRRHYLKPGNMPGGVFVPEVGINGPMRQQRCDALYVGFTSSSGRLLVGHEVKVSRSDWRHELDQPHKADRWSDQCHAWYVVAPSIEVVKPEELPHGWGLLTINPRTTTRLDVTVKAATYPDREPAWWAVRSLIARNDTLTWQAIADKAAQLVEARVKDAVRVAESNRLAMHGRDAELAANLRAALRTHRRGDDMIYASDDDLVAAVVALLRNQQAARQLRDTIQRHVRSLRALTDPLRDAYGPLAELADTIGKDTP